MSQVFFGQLILRCKEFVSHSAWRIFDQNSSLYKSFENSDTFFFRSTFPSLQHRSYSRQETYLIRFKSLFFSLDMRFQLFSESNISPPIQFHLSLRSKNYFLYPLSSHIFHFMHSENCNRCRNVSRKLNAFTYELHSYKNRISLSMSCDEFLDVREKILDQFIMAVRLLE